MLRLEVQGGDVVEHDRERAARRRVSVCGGGDLGPPVLLHGPGQRPPHRRQRRRIGDAELVPHPQRVRFRCRLDDAGKDELLERVVPDSVEPETGIGVLEDLPQHPRPGPGDDRPRRPRRRRRGQRVEIELLLPVHLCDPLPRDRDERGQLGVVVSGAEVLEDGLHTPPGARDLHRRRSRPGAHLPHEQAHRSSLDTSR